MSGRREAGLSETAMLAGRLDPPLPWRCSVPRGVLCGLLLATDEDDTHCVWPAMTIWLLPARRRRANTGEATAPVVSVPTPELAESGSPLV